MSSVAVGWLLFSPQRKLYCVADPDALHKAIQGQVVEFHAHYLELITEHGAVLSRPELRTLTHS